MYEYAEPRASGLQPPMDYLIPPKLTFDKRREPVNYGSIPNHDAKVTLGLANVDAEV
jgi:hypothetical protein